MAVEHASVPAGDPDSATSPLSHILPEAQQTEMTMAPAGLLQKIRDISVHSGETISLIQEAIEMFMDFVNRVYPVISRELVEGAFMLANAIRKAQAVLPFPSSSQSASSYQSARYLLVIEEIYHKVLGKFHTEIKNQIVDASKNDPFWAALMYQHFLQKTEFVKTPEALLEEVSTILAENKEPALLIRGALDEFLFFLKRFPAQVPDKAIAETVFILINYLYTHQNGLAHEHWGREAYQEFTALAKKQQVTGNPKRGKAEKLAGDGRKDILSILQNNYPVLPDATPDDIMQWIALLDEFVFASDFNSVHRERITAMSRINTALAAFLYERAREERDDADRQGFTDMLIYRMQSISREHLVRMGHDEIKNIIAALEFAWHIHESGKITRWDAKYSGPAREALNYQLSGKNCREQLSMLLRQHQGLLIAAPVTRELYPLSYLADIMPELLTLPETGPGKITLVLDMSSSLQTELDDYMAQDDPEAIGLVIRGWAWGHDREEYENGNHETTTIKAFKKLHDYRGRITLHALHDDACQDNPLADLISTASTLQRLINLPQTEKFIVLATPNTLESRAGLKGNDGLQAMMPGISHRLDLPVLGLNQNGFQVQEDSFFLKLVDRSAVARNDSPGFWSLPSPVVESSGSHDHGNHYQLVVQLEDSTTANGDSDIFKEALNAQLKKDARHSLLVFLPKGERPFFLASHVYGSAWRPIPSSIIRNEMIKWPPGKTHLVLFGLGRDRPDGQRELAGRDEETLALEISGLNNELISLGIMPLERERMHIRDASWASAASKARFEQRVLSEQRQNWEGIPTFYEADDFASVPLKKKGQASKKITETIKEFWQHENEGAGKVQRAKIAVRLWKEIYDYIVTHPGSERIREFKKCQIYIAINIAALKTEARYQEEVQKLKLELIQLKGNLPAEYFYSQLREQNQDTTFRKVTAADVKRYRVTQPDKNMLDALEHGEYGHRENGKYYLKIDKEFYRLQREGDIRRIIYEEDGAAGPQAPRSGLAVNYHAGGAQWVFDSTIGRPGGDASSAVRSSVHQFMKDTLSNFVRKELGAFLDSQAAVLTAGAQEVVTRKQLIEGLSIPLSILLKETLMLASEQNMDPAIREALLIFCKNEKLHAVINNLLKQVFSSTISEIPALAELDEIQALLGEELTALLRPELYAFATNTERPLLSQPQFPTDKAVSKSVDMLRFYLDSSGVTSSQETEENTSTLLELDETRQKKLN